ncbi:hypothetical protein F9C28_02900 [Shimwellia pseudoproteus]|uniref:hypothetical protein n=1 Tax=Shimwellia pseudoproteus TaxID=570012 RepID=UPI0018EC50BB|nr:hypothetical protein [Shimwellia pseudoproteus]MBJ3813906.1 hypothetical protein [Shimwellia pseudoproteus]
MNRIMIITTGAVLLASSFNASAISEAYRKQLARSGCTQLTDGNGCDSHKTRAENFPPKNSTAPATPAATAMSGPAAGVAHDLDKKVVGKYQGQAVDAMITDGWKRLNTRGTKWSKAGFTAEFDINTNGQVMGTVVHPQ